MPELNELVGQIEDEALRSQIAEQVTQLSGSTLRQKVDELSEENKTLKQEGKHRAYKDAGLPDGAYDVFDTMYDGELTPEALQGFAQAKGFQVNATGQKPAEGNQSLNDGEARLDGLNAGAIPVRDPTLDDEISEAETAGDWDKATRLKVQKLEALRSS